MEKVMFIESDLAEQVNNLLGNPDSDTGRGEVIFDREVVFSDGNRMAVQVVASNEPSEEPCWSQGVLFDSKGNELGCTDVGESLLGEFIVNDYVTNVKIK